MSFYRLYENSLKDNGKDFWFKPPENDEGKEVIQRGLEIRSDRTDGNTFWDDFESIIGQNTDEVAKLLGVSRDRVATWPNKIKRLLDAIRQENDNESKSDKKKSYMLPTGNM